VALNGVSFAAGEVGQAFSFDGVDDMVTIPESPAIDLSRMPAWTVEAWVRPTSFTNQIYPTIYSEGSWGVSLGLQNETGNLETWINNNAAFHSTMALPINVWSHVALTYSAGDFSFYINGIFAGSFAATILPDSNGSAIGAVPLNPDSSQFQGQIDELSVYQRALTDTELTSIYNAGPAGKTISGLSFATQPRLPDALVNQAYTQTITAVRGTAPVAYTITSGALPPGLALNSSGVLDGTSAAAGLFNFVVRATDAASLYVEESFSLQVFAPAAAPSGLAAWWRAENDALDSVGANNGVALNGVGFGAGKVGQAFSFDGVDDRIAIPEASAIDLSTMPAWTVEAWVRPASFTSQNYPTIYSEGSWGVSLGLQNGTGKLETWINNSAVFRSTMALPINAWSHVALTHSAGNFAFYINGNFAGSFAATILPDSNGSAIGDVPLNPDSSRFQGQIDEVSIYQRALTDTELVAIYNAGLAGKSLAAVSLALQLSATNTVLVLWPSYPAGFLLQENTNLSSTNWTSSSGLVNDDGTNKFIVVNPPVGARFYRLARP
jgi:hypothetical protein